MSPDSPIEPPTTPDTGRLRRRAALAAGGAATVSAAALLAPAWSSPTPAPSAPASGNNQLAGPNSSEPTGGAGTAVGPASAVPVGGGVIYPDESVVVTQPTAGDFKAFSAICTHRGCTVSSVTGGTINCPCHGSKFKITDGSVAHGPAKEPLPAKQVTNDGGTLRVS